MNSASLKRVYEKLPESVKLIFAPIIRKGMIGNITFQEQYEELVKADNMTEEEVAAIQFKKLKDLCIFAYENTGYYKRVFDEVMFTPYTFETVEEFTQKVPVLEKADVLGHYEDINVKSITGDYPACTGGSTGTRLVINNAKDCFYRESAFLCHHYLKVGYNYKTSKVAYFGGMGESLVSASPLYNMMRYNSKLINIETIAMVAKSLNRFKPNYIQGLPSAIYFFCKLLAESSVGLSFLPRGIILASENIYPEQRKYMETVLGCKALAHYGHTERVLFAEEIPGDNLVPQYKFNPLYGITEIDSEDNCLIGTGFINYKMPLLRYKTDDTAISVGQLYKIEGHRTAAMIGRNGERISTASFAHMDSTFAYIDKFQFEQDTPGKIKVHLVCSKPLYDAEFKKIKAIFVNKFKGKMEVSLDIVSDVKLTPRGKFALLIQHIRED